MTDAMAKYHVHVDTPQFVALYRKIDEIKRESDRLSAKLAELYEEVGAIYQAFIKEGQPCIRDEWLKSQQQTGKPRKP